MGEEAVEMTLGDIREEARTAGEEAAKSAVEELRTSWKDELRAIARDGGDEVVADQFVESEERTRKRWGNMDSRERSRRLGSSMGGFGPTPAQRRAMGRISSDNKFVRMLPYIYRQQSDTGDWHWRQVADLAEKGIEVGVGAAKHVHQDKEIAGVIKDFLDSGTSSSASSLIPTEFMPDVIEFLYATTVLRQMGARTIPMEGNTLAIPRFKDTSVAYWVGEGFPITESTPEFDQPRLNLKKLGIIVALTNELINRAPQGAESIVQDDMQAVSAIAEDIAGIRSEGSSHRPTGILHQISSDNKITSTANDTATIIRELARLIYLVEGELGQSQNSGWIFTQRTRIYLSILQDSNDNLVSFAQQMADGQLLTHPVYATKEIPTKLGDGSDETEIYFGHANQLMIGEGVDMRLDTFDAGQVGDTNLVTQDAQANRLVREVDYKLRHPNAFAAAQGVDFDSEFDG